MRQALIASFVLASACAGRAKVPVNEHDTRGAAPSFADDIAFLTKHGDVHVLSSPSGAKVAVSAKYQGRVMTSAVSAEGRSLGWIHREFISKNQTGTPFDNFGGEDRFWLGPEGGQYGLYFPPKSAFTFDAWQTPHAMQEGEWALHEDRAGQITFTKTMSVTSWSGVTFDVDVSRTIEMLDPSPGAGAQVVAYRSINTITNAGKTAWKKETGLLSIWILAMYAPVPDTRVVIPFEKGSAPINDAYFGKVPAERLEIRDGYLLFTCDGVHRSKIGLPPSRAKDVLGSYSASARLLTIVRYDGPKAGAPYVNSMWELQKEPYAGDVVNSYNDGPPAPGKPRLGGFYEIETSSPGAELAPGEKLAHTVATFHYVGDPAALDPIAKKALGVSLADVQRR